MSKILVTGGAGYVGSHIVLVLLENGYDVTVIDNMANAVQGAQALPESLHRVQNITNKKVTYAQVDLLNKNRLPEVFQEMGPFDCVIHVAAMKSIRESGQFPLKYYANNFAASINLLEVMEMNKCKTIVFSSSATVYGHPQYLPLDEKHSTGNCTNPYGKSKFMTEELLRDVCHSDPEWTGIILRYFNPIGAHKSGMIGEDPLGTPSNLFPFIAQVAVGRQKELEIYGNDYDTPDGTCVRDFIHVMDLAQGHLAAVERAQNLKGWTPLNLGTGRGTSVLEMVAAFEEVSGQKIPFKICRRREGDPAVCFTDSSLAQKLLEWTAQNTIEDMCMDSWKWQSKNPQGFRVV